LAPVEIVSVGPHFGSIPVPPLNVQFWNWNTHIPKLTPCQFGAPSSGTGCPVLELGSMRFAIYPILEWFWYWALSCKTPNRLSLIPKLTPRQKKVECRFGNVGVPVPELDIQCRNWNGAKMGSNINIFCWNKEREEGRQESGTGISGCDRWHDKISSHLILQWRMTLKRVLLCQVHHALFGSTLQSAKFWLVVELWLERCFGRHGGQVG
jgi:hypothetical protein